MDQLRKNGKCDIEYRIPPEIRECCGFKEKVIKFKTHRQLDEFVDIINKKAPTYFVLDEKGKDDFALLKSFDRAFWLRYYKHKSEEHKPHDCPFRDPQESGSIYQNIFTYD